MDLALSVPQIPSPGETIQAIACEMIPGGKGANQAYACGRLGGSCVFLSAVGEDEAGERLLRNLRSAGVVTDHIIRAKVCRRAVRSSWWTVKARTVSSLCRAPTPHAIWRI